MNQTVLQRSIDCDLGYVVYCVKPDAWGVLRYNKAYHSVTSVLCKVYIVWFLYYIFSRLRSAVTNYK